MAKTLNFTECIYIAIIALVTLVLWPWSYNLVYIKEIVLTVGTLLLLFTSMKSANFKAEKPVIIGALFLVWSLIATITSAFPYAGWQALSLLVVIFIFFIITVFSSALDTGHARTMITIAAIPAILAGTLQAVFPHLMRGLMVFGNDPPSTFGNPNFFAAFLAAVLPFYLSSASLTNGIRRTLYYSFCVLIVMLIITAGSKAAYLALLFEILAVAFFFIRKKITGRKKLYIYCGAAVAAVIIGLALNIKNIEKNDSVFFRLQVWKGAAAMLKDNFIKGSGPGTFAAVYPQYRPREIMKWSNEHSYEVSFPENMLLQAAVETGLAGAAIIVIFFCFIFRGIRDSTRDFGLALAALILVNMFGVDLNFTPSAALLAFISGIIIRKKIESETKPVLKINAAYISAAAVALLLSFFVQVRVFISDIFLKKGVSCSTESMWQDAINNYKTGLQFNPDNVTARYFLASAYFDSDPEKYAEDSMREFEEVEKRSPDFVLLHYKKGRIFSVLQDFDRAQEEYVKMLKTDPYLKPAIKEIAYIYFSKKQNFDIAESYILTALEKYGDDASLYNILGNIYFAAKRAADAIAAYKKAIDLKGDKDYYYNLGCLYFTLNDLKNARKYLKKAKSLSTDEDPRMSRVLRVISQYDQFLDTDERSK